MSPSLNQKEFDSLAATDLQGLLDDKVPEGKTIEYKERLPGSTDADKKEFLADASSFANAAGGMLIFGIAEKAGIPVNLSGLGPIDPDAEIARLENMARDGIDPRIPGLAMRAIQLQGSMAIVVRVPRSWALPHMVTSKGHSRFYSRNSAGKYPLDVGELRSLFGVSAGLTRDMRSFRTERLSKIVAGETPIPVAEAPKIVLHLIPFAAFDPASRVDLDKLTDQMGLLGPIYSSSWSHRHNFDGFLTYGRFPQSADAHSYLQILRSGTIEAVEAYLLGEKEGKKIIPSIAYEKEVLRALPRFIAIQKHLGVEPPIFIALALLGVAGYILAVNPIRFGWDAAEPIDRDALLIPEVVIEDFEFDPALVMRPIFDSIWNATGWPRSMNYDDAGKWVGH